MGLRRREATGVPGEEQSHIVEVLPPGEIAVAGRFGRSLSLTCAKLSSARGASHPGAAIESAAEALLIGNAFVESGPAMLEVMARTPVAPERIRAMGR